MDGEHVWGLNCQKHHTQFGDLQSLLQDLLRGDTQLWLRPLDDLENLTVHFYVVTMIVLLCMIEGEEFAINGH